MIEILIWLLAGAAALFLAFRKGISSEKSKRREQGRAVQQKKEEARREIQSESDQELVDRISRPRS